MGALDFKTSRRHSPWRANQSGRSVFGFSRSRSRAEFRNCANYKMGLRRIINQSAEDGEEEDYIAVDERWSATTLAMARALKDPAFHVPNFASPQVLQVDSSPGIFSPYTPDFGSSARLVEVHPYQPILSPYPRHFGSSEVPAEVNTYQPVFYTSPPLPPISEISRMRMWRCCKCLNNGMPVARDASCLSCTHPQCGACFYFQPTYEPDRTNRFADTRHGGDAYVSVVATESSHLPIYRPVYDDGEVEKRMLSVEEMQRILRKG